METCGTQEGMLNLVADQQARMYYKISVGMHNYYA